MKFKVVSSDNAENESLADPKKQILDFIDNNPVFLFMKGTPNAPQCGFSSRVVQILNSWKVPYKSFNVLSNENIRQGIKDYSNWPTIPQLYINKEFVGGCDIIEEISENGELGDILQKTFPNEKFNPPPPPAEIIDISSKEASEILLENKELKLLDLRTNEERNLATIKDSIMLDSILAQEILEKWEKNKPIMLICHTGTRSKQAADYFVSQGFQNVYNIYDGIDGWSINVDSNIPRYSTN